MAYIGRGTENISNVEVLDNLTFNGSASYTLQKSSVNFVPSSANNLLISISGVVQQGNFSVSGSTITFDTTVSGSDTCDWILHYGTGLITTPADGTVTTAKLANSSVSLDKLTATGTKDATTFLRGDNSFATVSSYTNSDALTLFNASGSAPVYACRAWVNFNGTGTVAIRDSGNVSSITDNGTGDYTVNFTTAMPDTNYAASAFSCGYDPNFGTALVAYYPTGTGTYTPQTKTTSAARIYVGYTNAGVLNDNADMSFIVYR